MNIVLKEIVRNVKIEEDTMNLLECNIEKISLEEVKILVKNKDLANKIIQKSHLLKEDVFLYLYKNNIIKSLSPQTSIIVVKDALRNKNILEYNNEEILVGIITRLLDFKKINYLIDNNKIINESLCYKLCLLDSIKKENIFSLKEYFNVIKRINLPNLDTNEKIFNFIFNISNEKFLLLEKYDIYCKAF